MKFIYPILFLSLLLPVVGSAQDGSSRPSEQGEKRQIVQINGLGRANINNTSINGDLLEGDTSTARKLTDGEFLLDLLSGYGAAHDRSVSQTLFPMTLPLCRDRGTPIHY